VHTFERFQQGGRRSVTRGRSRGIFGRGLSYEVLHISPPEESRGRTAEQVRGMKSFSSRSKMLNICTTFNVLLGIRFDGEEKVLTYGSCVTCGIKLYSVRPL